MPRCFAFALPFALVSLVPALSLAAPEDCPDGWFCEPPNASPAPLPTPRAEPDPARPAAAPGAGPESAPPPAPPPPPSPPTYPIAAQGTAEGAPARTAPAQEPLPQKRHRRFREWGFNLHLEGALLADMPERDAKLGGLGFAFRYRAIPRLAVEAGVDFLRGAERYGAFRTDTSLLLNLLVFFNPRDVVQVYGFGGLSFSSAGRSVVNDTGWASSSSGGYHYSYFGGQLGLGLEVRVSQRIAVGGDLVGFIRGRTDGNSSRPSDYVDGSNSVRNDSSSGGLLRAGVTFYW